MAALIRGNHLFLLWCLGLSTARYIYLDSCNFASAALINSFWLQFLQQQQLHVHFLSQLQLHQQENEKSGTPRKQSIRRCWFTRHFLWDLFTSCFSMWGSGKKGL